MFDPYAPGPRCVHCNDPIDPYSPVIVVSEEGETRRTILGIGFLRHDSGPLFHAQCHALHLHVAARD